MKKILSAALLVALSVISACAQPTLTGANSNPVPGDLFLTHYYFTPASAGTSGTGITWDFSFLSSDETDTENVYVGCSSITDCAVFPGANLADGYDGYYNLLEVNDSQMAYLGYIFEGIDTAYFTAFDFLRYPFTYGNSFSETSKLLSSSDHEYVTFTRSVDAYGTLITPTGTYSNVLRIHDIYTNVDSDIVDSTVSIETGHQYSWFTPGYHSALLFVSYDSDVTDEYMDTTVYFTTQIPTAVAILNNNAASLQLYPNPSQGAFNLNVTGTAPDAHVIITNLVGQKIKETNVPTNQNNNIALEAPPGLYLLTATSGDRVFTQKITVTR